MDISDKILPDLIEIVETEKPDLILYDTWALHTKYLLRILDHSHRKAQIPSPSSIMFTPFFAWSNDRDSSYPNEQEIALMLKPFDLNFLIKMIMIFVKQFFLNLKFKGLNVFNTLSFFLKSSDSLNIVIS
jgi:hypothetical protein